MNKFKQLVGVINANKKQIITRTVIIGAGVVGVTLATGLIKVKPSAEAVELAEATAKAVKKAAE